jgi:hypothetical protein
MGAGASRTALHIFRTAEQKSVIGSTLFHKPKLGKPMNVEVGKIIVHGLFYILICNLVFYVLLACISVPCPIIPIEVRRRPVYVSIVNQHSLASIVTLSN